MTRLMIVEPLSISVLSSRGTGAENLRTFDPKEVWTDAGPGTSTLTVDFGSAKTIDTIFLGYVRTLAADATWAITGGLAGPGERVIQASTSARVLDPAGEFVDRSHALWFGPSVTMRYLAITLVQPLDATALTAGVLVVGRALVPDLGQEWGAGRRLIDTGSVTSLPSGGFAVVEGARKRALTWTFGDLTDAEVEKLEMIGLRRGETATALVVENAERTVGLWSRIHYGLFKWRAFERRNKAQTRWEMEIEQWV